MENLASYLAERVPNGMSHNDAAQLCLRLYVTVAGVPENLRPLSKEKLGDAFAELARVGWVHEDEHQLNACRYGAHHHLVTDRGHWIEVTASIFKKGPDVYDREKGEALAQVVGFVSH